MAKSVKRKRNLAAKRIAKTQRMAPGTKSNYAKKVIFLKSNGGWGFDYPDKPWK